MTRVQRRRGVKGWRKPPNTVIVDRTSRWGNPFTVKVHGRDRAIELYTEHLCNSPELVTRIRRELVGRDLACFCALDEACHADVLLRVAAGGAP